MTDSPEMTRIHFEGPNISFDMTTEDIVALEMSFPHVKALVEAAKKIGCYRFHKPGEPEWDGLQDALAPFEVSDAA